MKGLTVALSVVVLSFGASVASATWMAPAAIYDSSPYDTNPGIGPVGTIITNLIDGNPDTYVRLSNGGDPATEPAGGYVVFDMGEAREVSGFRYETTVASVHPTLGPKDIDIFYWTDEATNAHAFAPNVVNSILTDAHILHTTAQTLPAGGSIGNEWVSMDLLPGDRFTARYVGLRFNSGYDTPARAGIFMADAQINTTVTPEPNALILLCIGLIGLLGYAWKKRR